MIVKIYRKYIPKSFRDKIYIAFLGKLLLNIRRSPSVIRSKYVFLFYKFLPHTEKNQLYAFMGKYGLIHIPYSFALEYRKMPMQIFWDEQYELHYVIHAEKRLYFPTLNKEEIINNYRLLLMEQHIQSPHRYLENINRLKGKTVLDIGAAEGMFTLNAIEIIEHSYLFECDDLWIHALNATFAPWKEKVTIVKKYVSDINDEKNITIDQFLEGKNKTNLFMKMDVEGYEMAVLKGAKEIIQGTPNIDFSICTYHNKDDAAQFALFFKNYSVETEYTEGFVFYDKDFRKAIIRKKISFEKI